MTKHSIGRVQSGTRIGEESWCVAGLGNSAICRTGGSSRIGFYAVETLQSIHGPDSVILKNTSPDRYRLACTPAKSGTKESS